MKRHFLILLFTIAALLNVLYFAQCDAEGGDYVGSAGRVWRGYEPGETVCGTTTPRNCDVRRGNAVRGSTDHADIPVNRNGRLWLGCPVRNIVRGVATPAKKVRVVRMNGKR